MTATRDINPGVYVCKMFHAPGVPSQMARLKEKKNTYCNTVFDFHFFSQGDEITFDYGTSEEHDQMWTCMCGTKYCRGKITGDDWRIPEVQQRYKSHFLKHIQEKIDSVASVQWGEFVKG